MHTGFYARKGNAVFSLGIVRGDLSVFTTFEGYFAVLKDTFTGNCKPITFRLAKFCPPK